MSAIMIAQMAGICKVNMYRTFIVKLSLCSVLVMYNEYCISCWYLWQM